MLTLSYCLDKTLTKSARNIKIRLVLQFNEVEQLRELSLATKLKLVQRVEQASSRRQRWQVYTKY